MRWPSEFPAQPETAASVADVKAFVECVFAPLSKIEIEELLAEHRAVVGDGAFDPPFDPSAWQLPEQPLPKTYLSFLLYSNGGYFAGVNRELDPLFNTREIRDYMLGYSIPHWMPMSCPFGFDGGGSFYLFDMRCSSSDGEYPVLLAHAGNLGYDDAINLADSFTELLETRLGKA